MKQILLIDDDSRDVELTLAALEENHLANKVTVAKNGEVALDYLHRRGQFKTRDGGQPLSSCSNSRWRRSTGWKC